jgi:hypothetical protein
MRKTVLKIYMLKIIIVKPIQLRIVIPKIIKLKIILIKTTKLSIIMPKIIKLKIIMLAKVIKLKMHIFPMKNNNIKNSLILLIDIKKLGLGFKG